MTDVVLWEAIESEAHRIATMWRAHVSDRRIQNVYGVPRGGCVPAALVATRLCVPIIDVFSGSAARTLVVDDLVDSGKTARRFAGSYFDALFRKSHSPRHAAPNARTEDRWLTFPWETTDEAGGPVDAVVRLLEFIGENPAREGLAETPDRVLRAWSEMTSGYNTDIASLFKTFDSESYNGMVIVRGVDFVSVCEHHMLPFTGTATVAYIPSDGRVVGLSKLARLVDAHARRLQVQERMTHAIAEDIVKYLAPEGVGVVVRAHHECMSCRGVRKANAEMVTSSLRGALYDKPEARAEFMRLAGI